MRSAVRVQNMDLHLTRSNGAFDAVLDGNAVARSQTNAAATFQLVYHVWR